MGRASATLVERARPYFSHSNIYNEAESQSASNNNDYYLLVLRCLVMAELNEISNVGEAGSPEQGPAGKGQAPIRSTKAKPSKASAEAVGRTTATPEKGARSKGTPILQNRLPISSLSQ